MPEDRTAILDKVVAEFQQGLLDGEARVASEMVRAYAGSWRAVRNALLKLEKDIPRVESGELTERNWFYQNRRMLDLKPLIESELKKFGELAKDKISQEQIRAIERALGFSKDLIVLGLGGLYDIPDELRIRSLPTGQIQAMVGMNQPGSPLSMLFNNVMAGGADAAFELLSEAVTLGYNPRKVAPRMRDLFGMTLTRALTISRTELARATRIATQENYKANADVVKEWQWNANPDRLTCPTCMIMHGTTHPIDERMDSHPNCRCVPIPVTISWEELGARFGLDLSAVDGINKDISELAEKYGLTPEMVKQYQFSRTKGTDYLSGLPPGDQIGLLGASRWGAWRDGAFSLEDMVKQTWSPVWGKGYALNSVNSLLGGDSERISNYSRLGREYARIVTASVTASNEAEGEAVRLLNLYRTVEPGVTNLLKNLVEEAGGKMEGLKHRLKSFDSLARKITSVGKEEGKTPREAADTMRDVIRYTGVFRGEELIQKARGISDTLTGDGWEVLKVRNYYGGGGNYEGLHYVFGNGKIQMEFQFHTEESFRIKMANHYDYEVYRSEGISPLLKGFVNQLMLDNWAGFNPPDDFGSVKNSGD